MQPGALVHGDLIVYSSRPPQISLEAQVLGYVDYHKIESAAERESSFGSRFHNWLFRVLWLVVLGVAFLALSRRRADRIPDTMPHQFGMSLVVGFLGLVIVPVLVVLLFITLIGLPLGLLLLAVYGVALMLSGSFVAYEFGS